MLVLRRGARPEQQCERGWYRPGKMQSPALRLGQSTCEGQTDAANGTPAEASAEASEQAADEDSGTSTLVLVLGIAAALIVVGAAVWVVRQRRA